MILSDYKFKLKFKILYVKEERLHNPCGFVSDMYIKDGCMYMYFCPTIQLDSISEIAEFQICDLTMYPLSL